MNWMNKWENAKSNEEDARIASAEILRARSELEHIETLVKENVIFIQNEIAHGKFYEASKALSDCKERFTITNPELLEKISEIENILENIDQGDDKQFTLPL